MSNFETKHAPSPESNRYNLIVQVLSHSVGLEHKPHPATNFIDTKTDSPLMGSPEINFSKTVNIADGQVDLSFAFKLMQVGEAPMLIVDLDTYKCRGEIPDAIKGKFRFHINNESEQSRIGSVARVSNRAYNGVTELTAEPILDSVTETYLTQLLDASLNAGYSQILDDAWRSLSQSTAQEPIINSIIFNLNNQIIPKDRPY